MTSRAASHAKLDDLCWLHGAYVDAGRSVASIAAEVGVGQARVRTALQQFAIPRRAPGGSTVPVEVRARLRAAAWLEAKLADEGLSDAQVADELGVARSTVVYWRRQHGLRPLTTVERIERHVGQALSIGGEATDLVAWVRRRHVADGWSWTAMLAALHGRVLPRRLRRLAGAHGFTHQRPPGRQISPTARQRLSTTPGGFLHLGSAGDSGGRDGRVRRRVSEETSREIMPYPPRRVGQTVM